MKKVMISSLLVIMLCGCGLTKQDLGLEKSSPDEMMVVSRAPLSIPPEFGLRPITVETAETEEISSVSAGEQALLKQMK